ncbi:MBL fold metallo-hydrolase [Tenacibaculum ovolyticum]|uniref:MBL fold metallo-hydrolase n=1 Tax=Tenacibaculum ovolyticum TaxID=104270 RepID=UPI0003FAC5D3|nr:MBL fold metallo-hydrolase [Tenacibaculum ovolyticum]
MKVNSQIHVNILTLLILSSLSLSGQKITSKNIINKLNNKYKFTANLKKFTVTYKYTGLNPYQSHHYKHPEDKINRFGIYTIEVDKDKKEYFTHDKNQFPGNFVFEFKHFQHKEKAISYDVNGVIRGKTLRELKNNAYERQSERVGNVLSFEQVSILLSNYHIGKPLKIVMNDTTAVITHINHKEITNTYTFEIPSLKLKTLESTEDNSIVKYKGYTSKNNIEYAERLDVYKSNKLSALIVVKNLKVISGIATSKFTIPEGYVLPKKDIVSETKITKITNNLYIINVFKNSRFILLKVIDNNIMVFGAPISDKSSEEVISLIERKFPMKTIQSVFVSHPHNDHIGGLNAYAKKGITILADDYTIDAIKNFPEFNKSIKLFKFKTLTNKININGVRFYVLKNEHSFKQSFAYFKGAQIIYEGDFLEIPADNSIATHLSNVEKQFIEFVREEKLKIKRIVQHHRNPNVSVETMNAYYKANMK